MNLIVKKKRLSKLLALLVILFIIYNASVSAQTAITTNPAYTTVTNPTPGTYNIEAAVGNTPVNSSDGRTLIINRLTDFTIQAGDTANILLNGSDTSINVISGAGGVNIGGILNSRTGAAASPIGGNMVLVSPNGIIVGAGGQINAGSILLTTSNQSILPLSPGFAANADLNNPVDDANIRIQGIDASGIARFINLTTDITIAGDVNSLNPTPVFQSTVSPIMGNGYGIYMFGRSIDLQPGSSVATNTQADIFLCTSNEVRWNFTNYTIAPYVALANRGDIQVQGTVTAPSGYINVQTDTNDILSNVINITGQLNADAIVPNERGGFITLRNNSAASPWIVVDGVAGDGHIYARGDGSGRGGSLTIMPTGSFRALNGGTIDLRNGPAGTTGGGFAIQSHIGVITRVGGVFLDPVTIASITLADAAARGSFLVYNSGVTPDMEVVGTINFPANSGVLLQPLIGNLNFNNGVNPITIDGTFTAIADNINVNGVINTTNGEIRLLSRAGVIDIAAGSSLNTVAGHDIVMSRRDTLGTLTVNAAGILSAGGGANNVIIGNTTLNDFTRTNRTLNGPTF
ncbi:MAG: hypothetical protein AB7V50_05955, partial [Vampirovibrionia bacterium]